MTLFEFLEVYGTFIALVTGIVGVWLRLESKVTTLQGKDNSQQKEIKELEEIIKIHTKEIKDMNPMWADIRERLVSIETTLNIMAKNK